MPDLPETKENNPVNKKSTGVSPPGSKVCLPAFLPTIQAKTTPQKSTAECQTSAVKRYLQDNELSTTMEYSFKPPTTPCIELVDTEFKFTPSVSDKSVNTALITGASSNHSKWMSKSSRRPSEDRSKRENKPYYNISRQQSTSSSHSPPAPSNLTAKMSPSYTYTDLVTHFSRISMRQVQATLNNTKPALSNIV